MPNVPTPGFDPEKYLRAKAVEWLRSIKFKSPNDSEQFARSVNDFAEQKLQEMQHAGTGNRSLIKSDSTTQLATPDRAASEEPLSKKNTCKPQLDKASCVPHAGGVQNEIRDLNGLIARLKKVTAPRGAKSALAKEFKVTRQAVNQWLSGESNPSADIAIRLQYWKPKLPVK